MQTEAGALSDRNLFGLGVVPYLGQFRGNFSTCYPGIIVVDFNALGTVIGFNVLHSV